MLKEFGADLKYLRESKNITVAEISAETRINPKFIINFEGGIFDFQPETYIRAFLREYAAVVGVDGYEMLSDYERAKSGFYSKKYSVQSAPFTNRINENEFNISLSDSNSGIIEKDQEIKNEKFGKRINVKTAKSSGEIYYGDKIKTDEDLIKSNTRKKSIQKIYIAFVIFAVLVGIYFLLNYLRQSGHKSNTDVKPKSFEEISGEFENTYKTKNEKNLQDSLKKILETQIKIDSLTLTVKTTKDVRIKIYIDDNKSNFIDEIIPAKDSLTVMAKELFIFSANNNSFELFLNGKQLQKLKVTAGMPVKKIKINKNGILTE